jgi:CRISPR-associated protein Csd2
MKLDQSTMAKLARISDKAKRYDFVFLVDIAEGNPNGDPDYDNRPRLDEETGEGLMTDVCIKRKIRDYIDIRYGTEPGNRNRIYVLNRHEFLEDVNANLAKECESDTKFLKWYRQEVGDPYVKDAKGKAKRLRPDVYARYACSKHFDWRCFGAVPGKPIENSTVRGPVQLQFGRSAGRISLMEHAIGRVVQNKPSGPQQAQDVHGTFGAKYTVRYGLYRFAGHYSAFLAKRTGFDDEDLKLFWEAMIGWPSTDSSAARSSMGVRGIYVFKHEDSFGNAPAHALLGLVSVPKVDDARSWEDYASKIAVPTEGAVQGFPGVTFHKLVG